MNAYVYMYVHVHPVMAQLEHGPTKYSIVIIMNIIQL